MVIRTPFSRDDIKTTGPFEMHETTNVKGNQTCFVGHRARMGSFVDKKRPFWDVYKCATSRLSRQENASEDAPVEKMFSLACPGKWTVIQAR